MTTSSKNTKNSLEIFKDVSLNGELQVFFLYLACKSYLELRGPEAINWRGNGYKTLFDYLLVIALVRKIKLIIDE